MRKLVDSMMRLSWAMSVFGAQQLAALASEERPGESADKLGKAFDEITNATAEDLDERFGALYESGEKMQRQVLDIACDVMDPRQATRLASNWMDWTATKLREMAAEPADDQAESPADDQTESLADDHAEAPP